MDVSENFGGTSEREKIAPAIPNATGEYSQGANFIIVINGLSTLIGYCRDS
jgi:hypothetical protein